LDYEDISNLEQYKNICLDFLQIIADEKTTKIISPSNPNYFFYQYTAEYRHTISRPINGDLFIEQKQEFNDAFDRFYAFLPMIRQYEGKTSNQCTCKPYLDTGEINKVVYTIQQSIGCIGDSFENANQSRKRVGDLFETLIRLIIREVGLTCNSRTIFIPVPELFEVEMQYQLDLVFSRNQTELVGENPFIALDEVVGSVKTTSKDRIDKIYLDKFLLSKFLNRNVPFIAIFLHDVQRSTGRKKSDKFNINATFKTNHFLTYSVSLTRLDGVYYVDPRPDMISNPLLRERISDFQTFLVSDLWRLSKVE
jgi:hypothetical protein